MLPEEGAFPPVVPLETYLVEKPDTIPWLDDVSGYIVTEAYS